MNYKYREEATKKLKQFILAAETSNLKEFNTCLTILSNWSKYILISIESPYSNGFTEGEKNNRHVSKTWRLFF